MKAILPPGTLPLGGGGRELIFLNLLHMNTHTDFQLPSSKTVSVLEIVVKWGRFYPLGPSPGGNWGEGSLLPNIIHMRDIHTNFQLPNLKTVNSWCYGGDFTPEYPQFSP